MGSPGCKGKTISLLKLWDLWDTSLENLACRGFDAAATLAGKRVFVTFWLLNIDEQGRKSIEEQKRLQLWPQWGVHREVKQALGCAYIYRRGAVEGRRKGQSKMSTEQVQPMTGLDGKGYQCISQFS